MSEATQNVTLADLQKQIAELQKQAAEAKKAERAQTVAEKRAAEKEDKTILRELIKDIRKFDLADAKAVLKTEKAQKEAEKAAAKKEAVTKVMALVEAAMAEFRMTKREVMAAVKAVEVTKTEAENASTEAVETASAAA